MPASATCPRCGYPAAADGPFCPRCGRYLAPLVWEAVPPPGPPVPVPSPRRPYTGPPRYRLLPRWGFPARPWQPPPARPPAADALTSARSLLGTLAPLLWAAASVALVACVAESGRYALLLASRTDALDAQAVRVSDALVAAAGTVAPIVALIAGALLVAWSVRAAEAAAAHAGVRPARSGRAIVLGWVVPGLNLAVPGSVLAEIEHCALARPPGQRPRPSPLLLAWWACWAADLLLTGVVLAWSVQTGVQARADGVVLHAALDLIAAATAGITAVLVTRLTRLLTPARAVRREVLVAVHDAERHPAASAAG